MSFRIINGSPVSTLENYKVEAQNPKETLGAFKEVLNQATKSKETFVISSHAAERLQNRNISFNSTDLTNINNGINKAEEKGAKDCLILYKDVALVTSIKNRTIITAMDKESSKGNVFTNLDSVVMI